MLWRQTQYFHGLLDRGDGLNLTVGPDGWRGTVTLFLPNATASVIARAKTDFMGYSTVKNNGLLRYVSRQVPYSVPGYLIEDGPNAGLPALWASSFQVEENYTLAGHEWTAIAGQAANTHGLPKFRWAKVKLGVSTNRYAVRADNDAAVVGSTSPYVGLPDESRLNRYAVVLVKPAIRTVVAPQGAFYWQNLTGAETAAPAAFGVPINEPTADVTIRVVDYPEIPWKAIRNCMGTVSATAFAGFPAGTLMCLAPDINPGTMSTGRQSETIDFKFNYNPKVAKVTGAGTERGHQWWLRRVKTNAVPPAVFLDYRPLNATGLAGGTSPFRVTEFRDLFKLDPTPP